MKSNKLLFFVKSCIYSQKRFRLTKNYIKDILWMISLMKNFHTNEGQACK